MKINQRPAVRGTDHHPADFRRLQQLFSHLTQQEGVFGKQRQPDCLRQRLGLQLQMPFRFCLCLGDFPGNKEGAEYKDNQKGKQGKDMKQFALKAGADSETLQVGDHGGVLAALATAEPGHCQCSGVSADWHWF